MKHKKQNANVKYDKLADQMERWWLLQLDQQLVRQQGPLISREIQSKTGCANADEFKAKYLTSWRDLDPAVIQEVFELLSQDYYFHTSNLLTFEVSKMQEIRFNALLFLLAQVERLAIFTLKDRDEIRLLYKQPEKQCYWCGQTDEDPNNDLFDGNLKACHVKGCPERKKNSNGSPFSHADRGCCSGHWSLMANSLKQDIRRSAANTEEAWEYLKAACEKLLEDNQHNLKFSLRYRDAKTNELIGGSPLTSSLSPAESLVAMMEYMKK
jgi:hypothetical protein